jgi:hypothetical protein
MLIMQKQSRMRRWIHRMSLWVAKVANNGKPYLYNRKLNYELMISIRNLIYSILFIFKQLKIKATQKLSFSVIS